MKADLARPEWRAGLVILGFGLALTVTRAAAPQEPPARPAAAPDYERDVVPILQEHCQSCHNASDVQGELLMDSHEDLMKGGEHGAAVVPGRSDQSRLVLMIEGKVKPKMPPKRELPAEALAVIKAWIDAGAEPSASSVAPPLPDIKPRVPRAAPVYSIAFSPDGKVLAVSGQREVRLLDPATGRLLRTLSGPSEMVRAVAFSADGKWLAAAGGVPARAGEVVLWNAATGEPARTITGHRDVVYAMAFSPNGRFLATSSYDKTIRLWYVSNGRERALLREHTDAVFPIAFSPDGSRLASGAGDRTVKVWDAAAGRRLFTLSDSLDTVYALAFHPSGKQLTAAGADKMLRTWDLTPEGGTLTFSAIAHEDAIVRLAYSADGGRMVTAGSDRVVKVWDVERRAELRVLPPQADWPMALATEGGRVAVGRYDGSVSVYDLETGRLQAELLRAAPRPAAAGSRTGIARPGRATRSRSGGTGP